MKSSSLAFSLVLSASGSSSSCSAFSSSLIHSSSRPTRTQLFQLTAEAEELDVDNTPSWDSKQHLYGLNINDRSSSSTSSVTIGADGNELNSPPSSGGLPLPETYITCGKCKSLFAIAEADLGTRGKGCRVKCSVCSNTWYQSRDRLLPIPTETHALLPANQSTLDRIKRNLAQALEPDYMGVNKLYVGNLDFSTSADDLKAFFERNGCEQVCDVSIITGPEGKSRGFAFVTFYDEVDGKRGLECNGKECNGRELAVREPNN